MYKTLGRPSVSAYAKSKRWNKEPIPAGSSDYDGRAGGGVSLTAVSDSSDKVLVSPLNRAIDNMGKKPATPKSTLRGDAKPFKSSSQTDTSPGNNSLDTAPTSINSADAKDGASQCATTQPMPPRQGRLSTGEEGDAALILMGMYQGNQQRARPITSAQQQHNGDEIHDYRHSSPIQDAAQGYATTETEVRMAGAEQRRTDKTQQLSNGNALSENYRLATMPAMDAAFQPTANSNGNNQTHHTTPTRDNSGRNQSVQRVTPEKEAFMMRGNTGKGHQLTPSRPGLSYKHRQSDALLTSSGAAAANFLAGSAEMYGQHSSPDSDIERHQPLGRTAYDIGGYHSQSQQPPRRLIGPVLDHNACLTKTSGPPPTVAEHLQAVEARQREWGHAVDYTINNKHLTREYFELPEPINGYTYGLHGSASDGTMLQYLNGQASTSKALTRISHEPINQSTIGPICFEMAPKEVMANRSEMLQAITENGQPGLQDLLSPNFLPFTEGYKYSSQAEENAVIVIRNIPYETTRSEVIALLGKSAKILNDREEPIHIIMDRVTSKTQDVYCELSSLNAAAELVERFKKGGDNGRIGRLGNRVVEIEMSSQTNLMATLFPSTKCGVNWIGTRPNIVMDSEHPWENFKGFITEEEMVMLSKHVETPQRSLYARICPERPYECMISTLRKFPWYMAQHITIKQRHSVYEASMKMIGVLQGKIKSRDRENIKDRGREDNKEAERLTRQLFDRLVASAMLCPGFSVVQKHNIATIAGLTKTQSREFNQPRFPDSWRHQWTLVPKAGMPIDVLEWYISVIRTETNRVVQSLDISWRMHLQGLMEDLDGYWGFFWAEANFPVGRVWDNMSLAECSRLEWRAIERIITRAVQGGNIPPSYTARSYHIDSSAKGSYCNTSPWS